MSDSFVNEFIDEYFAECDEHLATLRRVLLTLEEVRDRAPFPELMAELARALHTLKGLSGMVGFAEAEAVAHQMEDRVRAGTVSGRAFSVDAVSGLFEGAALLEACIQARRGHTQAPDITGYTSHGDAGNGDHGEAAHTAPPQTGAPPESPRRPELPAPQRDSALARAIIEGASLIEVEFTPSRERAAEGVTVDAVRGRLTAAGAILQATPHVRDTGVAFVFIASVRDHAEPPVFDGWAGIEVRPYEPPLATPVEDSGADGGTGVATGTAAAGSAEKRTAGTATADPAAQMMSSTVVRVDLSRLDELMRLVGDLVMSRARIDDVLAGMDRRDARVVALVDAGGLMERQLRDLREAIMRVRMVPIAEVFDRMRYAAREVARETGRQVAVTMTGQDTEVDKLVVERMMEPLLHLVRNAIGHGLETPEEREAAGKQATGSLGLAARAEGETIIIEVTDDGRGVDFRAIERRAGELGLIAAGTQIGDKDVLDLISAPGFSTRETIDVTSGRGVGMAVVRQRVDELGGHLSLTTKQRIGTRFTIRLPLTLMIVDAVMFRHDGHLMAVPQPGLIEVLQVDRGQITAFENNEVVPYRETVLPLFHLRALFGAPALMATEERGTQHVLVIGSAAAPVGIIVDRVVGQREIVVRALTDPLVTVPGISGATELSDGSVALIMDAAQIAQRVAAQAGVHVREAVGGW